MKRFSPLFVLLALVSAVAFAGDMPELTLRIRNHQFIPAQMDVPANTKFKLIVVNEDPTPEEFESHELNREKVVTGNHQIIVYLGPLKPGKYGYFGDFNPQTAQGILIAR